MLCLVLRVGSRWVLVEEVEVVRLDWMLGRHCELLVRLDLFLVLYRSVVLVGGVTVHWV